MGTNYLKERTNLRTILVAVFLLLIGIILLVLSESAEWISKTGWIKAVVSNLGGLLVATVSITLLWELFSKRAFVDELLQHAGLAEDIRSLGLIGLSVNPLRGPNFSKLIRTTSRLDIFVCYANTWRASYEEDLKILAKKNGAKIRLIVPNPDNSKVMSELAHRFNVADHNLMRDKINLAINEFKSIFSTGGISPPDFSVWVHGETPLTSFYRFDNIAVVTLYKHAKGRGNVPTFVAERGGTLFTYVEAEVDAMLRGIEPHPALARQIYPRD